MRSKKTSFQRQWPIDSLRACNCPPKTLLTWEDKKDGPQQRVFQTVQTSAVPCRENLKGCL